MFTKLDIAGAQNAGNLVLVLSCAVSGGKRNELTALVGTLFFFFAPTSICSAIRGICRDCDRDLEAEKGKGFNIFILEVASTSMPKR